MEKRIGIAVLGNGSRGKHVVANLLNASGGTVDVRATYDPDIDVARGALERWGTVGKTKICAGREEALNTPGVDWLMVFSPNASHKSDIMAGFAAGKHVFSEKPLATTIEDCREIYEAARKKDLHFATGFVLRYAPLYRRAKEILDSGILGKIVAIEGNENIIPAHGGYIMRNWRRYVRNAGPHILEKCCHDLDLILWYVNSLPAKVAAFGGRNFFRPENNDLMEKYGRELFCSWPDPHAIDTPFNDDNDLMDNLTASAVCRNGVRINFMATMSNAIPERRLYFSCTEGTMIVELYSHCIRYRRLGSDVFQSIDISGDGHGGGDPVIMRELYDTMRNGSKTKCGGREGLLSAVFALAIDRAAVEERVVDLEPIWQAIGQ